MKRFMNEQERWRCMNWISKFLTEAPRKQADSYVLKHMFQHMTGIYASDEEFREVMRECGFDTVEKSESLFNVRIDSVVIKKVYYNN